MMNLCSEFELLISQKLDNELSETEEYLLNEHLQTCVDCRTLYQELDSLHQTLSSFSVSPPLDLHDQIMKQINTEFVVTKSPPSKAIRKPLFSKWLISTAAALLLLISASIISIKLFPASSDSIVLESSEASTDAVIKDDRPPMTEDLSPTEPNPSVSNQKVNDQTIPLQETNNEHKNQSNNVQTNKAQPNDANTNPSQTNEIQINKDAETIESFASPSPSSMQENSNDQSMLRSFNTDTANRSEGISYEEAERLLFDFLLTEETAEPHITYQELSSDGNYYQFLYTDNDGETWKYFVSLYDGTISFESASGDHLSEDK